MPIETSLRCRGAGRDEDAELTTPTGLDGEDLEILLRALKDSHGVDFTGYKRSSLRRRVARRMGEVGIDDVEAYQHHLRVQPSECEQLFNTILINVTAFFRDADRWAYLERVILPQVVAAAAGGPIRVWSAGCASGEEPYTLAILFAELLGAASLEERIEIHATDVDQQDLRVAREGVYARDGLDMVPPDLCTRYFEAVASGRFTLRADVRRAVRFARHDLVTDAPLPDMHLVVCRNLLIYLESETQARVLRSLHRGLRDDGFLFLGEAEMLLTASDLFEPVHLPARVFRKSRCAMAVDGQYPAPTGRVA